MEYYPNNWVVIKIKGDDPHYRVLAGWSGGYTQGTSWKLNSGVTRVDETDTHYKFHGTSGSIYVCDKEMYGLRMNNAYVWNSLQKKHGDKVELMGEDTDWMNTDWVINAA